MKYSCYLQALNGGEPVDVLQKTNPIAGEDSKGQPVSFRVVNQECIVTNNLMKESATQIVRAFQRER